MFCAATSLGSDLARTLTSKPQQGALFEVSATLDSVVGVLVQGLGTSEECWGLFWQAAWCFRGG